MRQRCLGDTDPSNGPFGIGDELLKAGREVHLTRKEFELLAFLMQHRDIPITHAKLLRAVWGLGVIPLGKRMAMKVILDAGRCLCSQEGPR